MSICPLAVLVDDIWQHMHGEGMLHTIDIIMLGWAYRPLRALIRKSWQGRRKLVEAAYEGLSLRQIQWIGWHDKDLYEWAWSGFFDNPGNLVHLDPDSTIRDDADLPLSTLEEDVLCLCALLSKPKVVCMPFFEHVLSTDIVGLDALFALEVFEKIASGSYSTAIISAMERDAKSLGYEFLYANWACELFYEAVRMSSWNVVHMLYDETQWCTGVDINEIITEHESRADAMQCYLHCGGTTDEADLVWLVKRGCTDVVKVILEHDPIMACVSHDDVRALFPELAEADDATLDCLLLGNKKR